MKTLGQILSGKNEDEIFEKFMEMLWEKSNDGFKMEKLHEVEKHFIIAQQLHDSIYGGGINSLFYNNAGKLANAGLLASRALGDLKMASIIEQAIAAFPVHPIPDDLETCRQLMESWSKDNETDKKWAVLTNEFDAIREESISSKLNFVRTNQHLFQ